jgi:hypothetical protein
LTKKLSWTPNLEETSYVEAETSKLSAWLTVNWISMGRLAPYCLIMPGKMASKPVVVRLMGRFAGAREELAQN